MKETNRFTPRKLGDKLNKKVQSKCMTFERAINYSIKVTFIHHVTFFTCSL